MKYEDFVLKIDLMLTGIDQIDNSTIPDPRTCFIYIFIHPGLTDFSFLRMDGAPNTTEDGPRMQG